MLIDTTILDLIHGIELSLEENEITSSWGVLVKETFLKLLQSVNNLEEVAIAQEELEILERSLLYRSKI